MFKLLVSAIGALALTALFAAAASGSHSASTSTSKASTIPVLRVALDTVPTTLDPAVGGDTEIRDLGLETLTHLGPHLSVKPWLAKSVSHPNATTYVYHLRHGVKFWDGHTMTSADVVNTLNYDRASSSGLSRYYTSVASVSAKGKYTVVVKLTHPDASWAYVAATVTLIFEKKFQQAHGSKMGQPGTLIMGTGPFEYKSFDPNSGVKLVANKHWWHGKVNIKRINVSFIKDPTDIALAFRSGEIDAAPEIATNSQGFLSTAGGKARLVHGAACNIGIYSLNTTVAPFNNVHVRRAIAYAINRKDIIAAAGQADTTPQYSLIPKVQLREIASNAQIKSLTAHIPSYHFSLAKARSELSKSPVPHGFSTKFDTVNYFGYPVVAQAIAADLSKIGINVTVNTVGITQYLQETEGPGHTAGMNYLSYGCLNPDVSYFPSSLLGKASMAGQYEENFPLYNPAAVNKLVNQGQSTTNHAKRFAIYSKLLKRVANDEPYIPLVNQAYMGAISSKFTWKGYSWFEATSSAWPLDLAKKG